jgi:hypothetical protein
MPTQVAVTTNNTVNVTVATQPNIDVTISRAAVTTLANVAFANVANFAFNAGNANIANRANSAATVDGYIKVPFQYNNASPKNVAIIPANAVVSQVDVIVTTAFDDVNATLSLGTVANANLLLNATDSKPFLSGTYAAMPGQLFLSDTWTVLTINPGSSTTGSGMIVIYF